MASKNRLERTKVSRALAGLLTLLAIAVFINYIDRGNLSIAALLLKDELGVNPARLGFLLSAFFWTYAALQPVYGWLGSRTPIRQDLPSISRATGRLAKTPRPAVLHGSRGEQAVIWPLFLQHADLDARRAAGDDKICPS